MSGKLVRYGKQWPEGFEPFHAELWCWANYEKLKNPELERWRHLKNAVLLLDEEMRKGWNDWTEMMCWAYGNYSYIAAMGCGSSTKTHTFHKLAMYDYLSSMHKTTMTCTTTNSAGLEQRMWPVVSSTYQRLKKTGYFNDLRSTVAPQKMIRPTEGETKHVIRAVTIDPSANKEKIVDQLVGVHPQRRIWIVDEATSAPPAVLSAWANAMISTSHRRLIMLGNPDDYADTISNFCKPIDGWSSVSVESEKWEFEFFGEKGIALHFCGRKSPNLKFPVNDRGESKYPFMYDHKTLKAHTAAKDLNPKEYWRMCEGWFAPEGVTMKVCSSLAIERYKCKHHAMFRGGDIRFFASLDPAFGGDRCILKLWKMGYDVEVKKTVMDQVSLFEVPINPEKLPGEQIGKFSLDKCRSVGADTIGIDTTTNNSAAAEWLETNSDLKVIWIPFGGAASDREVSPNDKRPAKELYYNFAAELAFSVSENLEVIRGLDEDSCVELCARYWENIGDKPTRKKIESKKDYKSRMRNSPDKADATNIGFEVFRQIGGLDLKPSYSRSSKWNSSAKKKNDIWSTQGAYT